MKNEGDRNSKESDSAHSCRHFLDISLGNHDLDAVLAIPLAAAAALAPIAFAVF